MAFDQSTRNKLQRFVADARGLLTAEFTRQMQNEYGMDPVTGSVSPIETLHLDDSKLDTARILRDTLDHYRKGSAGSDDKQLLEQIAREQAFTVLNRFAALKMAEARGILRQSLDKEYQSEGFQLYQNVAGAGLGETGDAYKAYLFSIFDEFAVDLKVLFDRFSPTGLLFPKETVMLELLAVVNDPEIQPLWAEDETIGWIYQYFNTKEERKKMRDESAAPRNSRELAVRNQFFTPRYVVEFLTDNTLGRTWYEMTRGKTALKESCRYMVRRPKEIFLGELEQAAKHFGTDLEESGIPDSVRAAFQGDFAGAFDEQIGSNRWWIGLAIPPDQYETITGIPQKGLDDYPHLGDVWDALDGTNTSEHLLETDSLLAAFSQFILTSSGGPYAIEPTERLWNAISESLVNKSGDDASQEELLKRPVYVPFRSLKDPREILMLDPACGSMHFGLYAFDLFLKIYDEAWDLSIQPSSSSGLKPLRETYDDDKERFLLDVPRLIIENNIHGVDIDSRAVQIAGLSLWLRAQRAWAEQNIRAADRPQIRRSNIVCAEPMPGEADLLEEFIGKHFADTAEKRLLGEFVRRIFDSMKLAGEAGTLLKIEEEVAALISESREQWLKLKDDKENFLFEGARVNVQQGLVFEVADITDVNFWEGVESEIYKALRRYSESSKNGEGYQRRLFADDAAQGFAFIDLCRKRFDVAVMNPPFGEFSKRWKAEARQRYPNTANDIFAAFTERMLDLVESRGRVGAITSRNGFFLSSFKLWRRNIVRGKGALQIVVDLGEHVMDDAMVEAAAYCFAKNVPSDTGLFMRMLAVRDREQGIERAVQDIRTNRFNKSIFLPQFTQFDLLPNEPFVYWSSENALKSLSLYPTLKEVAGDVRQGLATADDPRFARTIWEIPFHNRWQKQNRKWVPYVKAGASQPWFSPITLVVNWEKDAAELWNNLNTQGSVRSNIWMLKEAIRSHFFNPGFSWTRRAVRFIPYVIPADCIPSASRYLAYPHPDKMYSLLGLSASKIASVFFRFYGEKFHFPNYMVETVKLLPVPNLSDELNRKLETLIDFEVKKRRRAYQNHEPFHEFTLPSKIWNESTKGSDLEFQLTSLLSEELEEGVQAAYGLYLDEDMSVALDFDEAIAARSPNKEMDEGDEDSKDFVIDTSPRAQNEALISYFVGCSFGHWDVNIATGVKPIPNLPDPFAPLPICPPGMLMNSDGLPSGLADLPNDYPVDIAWNGILVDDAGNPNDIEGSVHKVLQVIYKDLADAVEAEACIRLAVKSLGTYIRRPAGFFADHLKRYSKSRRQAPIYLPLSTKSGEYTLWLYYHRLSDQSLFSCINDFVEPKIRQVKDDVNGISSKLGRGSEDEKRLEQLTDLSFELEELRDELLRLAPIWKPNLNDGVQITMSPLWKLFRLPKWRKTLEDTWKKLEKGEYDWAHLAFALWPDRVREKCKKDKSLAIAHDLEDLYEEPPPKAGKKKKAVVQGTMEMFEDN